jgi:CCR4-NOT transcription complex subunit 1
MSSLLAVLFLLTSLAPDHLPLFTMPNAPPPHVYSRIIDPPATDGSISKAAMQQAAEIQGAGLWNTLGLVQILVAACGMADEERVSEETAEVGRRATELLDKAAGLASELVVVALERLKVSMTANAQQCRADICRLQKPLPAPVANLHSRLLSMYLSSTTSSDVTSRQLVFHQLYTNDPARLLQILSDFYNEDQSNLGLIIDIGLEVQVSDAQVLM